MLDRLTSLLLRQKNPFSDVRVIQFWWQSLGELDAVAQLKNVHDLIAGSLAAGRLPAAPEGLAALLWIDNAVQPALESVCHRYVSNRRMPQEIERQLSKDIAAYSQKLVDAYLYFIQLGGRENAPVFSRAEIIQAIARCLRYLALQAKWHYFHFEQAPSRLWQQAHQLYRLAELENFAANLFPLYSGVSSAESSCSSEYLRLLMLATVSSNNLSVPQIDWVDLWLASWSKSLQISRQLLPKRHHFFVNLQSRTGPQRIDPDAREGSCRYWGIGELVSTVQAILPRLEAGIPPAALGLGEVNSAAGAIELLRHLGLFWTMSMRNSRIQRAERKKVSKTAQVIHGLDNLCPSIKEDNDRQRGQDSSTSAKAIDYDELIDMRLYGFVSSRTLQKGAIHPNLSHAKPRHWQTWRVDNESIGGLGTILSADACEWVRPGVLLGVRSEEGNNWGVGILRRLNRINQDEIYAGIQMLSMQPIAVSMHSCEQDRFEYVTVAEMGYSGHVEMPSGRTGIYLPHKIDGRNVNTLILHSADYGQGRIYRVQAGKKVFSVSLAGVLEKGSDWSWITVEVLKQEA